MHFYTGRALNALDDDTEEGSGEAGDEAVEEVSGEMTDQHME